MSRQEVTKQDRPATRQQEHEENTMSQREVPEPDSPETPFMSSMNLGQGPQFTSRMRVTPRMYTGNGSTSWREYKGHFERVSRINGWRDEQKLDYLWVHLAEAALSYVETLAPERTDTYRGISAALEERFGDAQLAEVFKSELRSRRRRTEESLPALAQDINRLVQRAYPGMEHQAVEELAIERFREAIPEHEQRMAVFRSKAETLDQAVKAAIDAESWQISENRRASTQKIRAVWNQDARAEDKEEIDSTPVETRLQNQLESLATEVRMLKQMFGSKDNRPPRATYSQQRRCFYCDKPGHIIRDCFKKKRDEREKQQGNELEQC